MKPTVGIKNLRRVYEHGSLSLDAKECSARISDTELEALQRHYGKEGCPWYSLAHRGVKFKEYVGVLQVGSLTVEVLPKADNGRGEEAHWQKFLLTMLRTTGLLPAVTGTASLRLRDHSILDYYIGMFLHETEALIQRGLVRRYRSEEGNVTALKGALQFGQNIRHNLTHAERFFTRHTVYDRDHLHNSLLLQTLALIGRITAVPGHASRAAALALSFPDCTEVSTTEALFARLPFDRKTEAYRPALAIAKLLLLSLHPDLRSGRSEVLALMFDMNILWEKYVARVLRRALPEEFRLEEQVRNPFWRYGQRSVRSVRPDMVIYPRESEDALTVLDTKWKCPFQGIPDDADLKQMLVYNLYNKCAHSILVYPLARGARSVFGKFDLDGHGCCETAFIRLAINERTGMQLELKPLVEKIKQKKAQQRKGPPK